MKIQVLFDLGVQRIVLVTCMLCTAPTHCTAWQETSACYGADQKCSSYKIVCSPGQKIVLGELKYGTKFTEPTCQFGVSDCTVQEKICCSYSDKDGFTDFSVENRTNLLQNCEGKQSCSGWAPRLFNSPYSSYILIKYACVEDKKTIVNMCRSNRVEANEVFLSYGRSLGYHSQIGKSSTSCICRVTPRTCDAYLEITFVDLDFTRPGTTSTNCSNSVLTDSALGKTFGCLSVDNVRTMGRFSVLHTEDIVTLKVQPLGDKRDNPNYLLIYYYSTVNISVECFPADMEISRTTHCQTTPAITTPTSVTPSIPSPSSAPLTTERPQSPSILVTQTNTVPRVTSQIDLSTTTKPQHSPNTLSVQSETRLISTLKTNSLQSKSTSTSSVTTTGSQRTKVNQPIQTSSVVPPISMKSETASTSSFKTTGSKRFNTNQPMHSVSVQSGSFSTTRFTTIDFHRTSSSLGPTTRTDNSRNNVSLISVISRGSSLRSTTLNTQSSLSRNPVPHSSNSYAKPSSTNATSRTNLSVTKSSIITSTDGISSVTFGSSDATRGKTTASQSSINDLATASGLSKVASRQASFATTSSVEVVIDNNDDNGSNKGLIIGLAVGAVLLVAILTAVIVMCFCIRLKRNEKVRRNYIQNTNIFYSFPEDYNDNTPTEFDGDFTINPNYESDENENAPQRSNPLRLDDYKIKAPQVLDLNTGLVVSTSELKRSHHVKCAADLRDHETIDIVNNSVNEAETSRNERNNNLNGMKTVTFDDSSMYANVRKEGKTKF